MRNRQIEIAYTYEQKSIDIYQNMLLLIGREIDGSTFQPDCEFFQERNARIPAVR